MPNLIRLPDPNVNDVITIRCLCCGDMTFWPDWVCSFCDGMQNPAGPYLPNFSVKLTDTSIRPGRHLLGWRAWT